MKKDLYLSLLLSLSFSAVTVVAQQQAQEPMKKEQCLACHGPTFDDLIKKNVQAQSDSGPVNPHVWIPHAAAMRKISRNALNVTLSIPCHLNPDTRIPVLLLNLAMPATIIIN